MPKEDKKRVLPDLETDSFGKQEQDDIVEMILEDASADKKVMDDWVKDRLTDLQHYEGEKPSILENLNKKEWMSDRNLGLCASSCDTYQAVLYATVWNPDSTYFKATEANDIDNKDSLEKFAKWMVEPHECNVSPEVDDYIHNKIVQGFSIFKIYWKVWYEWVDRRMPKKDKSGYTIKTEHKRFEKGVIENIADLEDILLPRYGNDIQKLPHMIHIIHKYGNEILDLGKRKVFKGITEKVVEKFKEEALKAKRDEIKELEKEKAEKLGLEDIVDEDLRALPIDLYEWYGEYERGGKKERYRFIIEPQTETFLSGKPLRKITRDGKYPFVGGPFIRRPGFIKGKSLPRAIMHIVNAFNTIWNQNSDFQYVENCPFGFFKPGEEYQNQTYDLEPGVMYPSDDPQGINFPSMQRSHVWEYNDMKILFELLEKLTGAASYFLTTQRGVSGTATRDMLVSQKSETRFGIWVSRIQQEICQALTMLINLYQDWAPPKLGERVLGIDGKRLFHNLSIETLRGNYDARMIPDITSGSKAFERQGLTTLFQALAQSIWIDPRINPKGNWNLHADFAKLVGVGHPERYLGQEPPAVQGMGRDIEDEWARFLQGEEVEITPNENPAEHFMGHMRQKQEKYFDLDPEYRDNFDRHLFQTSVNFQKFLAKVQEERMANALATRMGGLGPQGAGQPPGGGPIEEGGGGPNTVPGPV